MPNKEQELKDLKSQMEKDTSLPLKPANLVFGEGDINSDILFIGEAPGQKEDELVRPFVGRSGQLLNKMLGVINLRREDVYITNIVKRRPPENRDPAPQEIEAYSPYLARQLEILRPLVIFTLGRFSMNYFLPEAKISKDQGKIFKTKDKLIVPMFHPAAALRNPSVMREFEETFKKLPAIVASCKKARK
jgi:uracil-DNA glycosylase